MRIPWAAIFLICVFSVIPGAFGVIGLMGSLGPEHESLLLHLPLFLFPIVLGIITCYHVMKLFSPVDDDGIDLLSNFEFNEPGSNHLRKSLNKRGAIRVVDLRRALNLHFKCVNELNLQKASIRFSLVSYDSEGV